MNYILQLSTDQENTTNNRLVQMRSILKTKNFVILNTKMKDTKQEIHTTINLQ